MSEVASGLARRAYWLCAKRGCNAWNWCDKRWSCKVCGTSAPPWTKEYRTDKGPPRVDADGFVQQPRGRAEQRAARRSASQRALSGSTAPSSTPNSRARRVRPWGEAKSQFEELQAQLVAARERVDKLQGALALGLSADFQREAESALQLGKDQVAALELAVQEAQRTERPPHSVLHIEANAIQKVERQLAAARTKKEKLQLQASELRELIAEKQEQLSAAELGVDEVAGQIAELEDTRAKVTQQAIQRASAAVGGVPSPLGDAVQGLLTQVGALSDLLKQHGSELPPRFSEIVGILNTQKEAVAEVLRPRSSSARTRWGDSVGDDGLATEDDDMPLDIVASGGPAAAPPAAAPQPGPTAAGPPAPRARAADGPYGPAAARGQHGATLGTWPLAEPCLAKALAEQGAALADSDTLAAGGAEHPCPRGAACPVSGAGQRAVRVAAVIGKAPMVGRAGGQQLRAGLVLFGCNGNTWSRSFEAIAAFFKTCNYWPDVEALQETRLPHERLPSAAAQARGLGYVAFLPEAALTDKQGPQATSGAAAILVRDGLQADESAFSLPSALRHRLSCVEVATASGLWFLALSGHFQHSVGPRGTNLDLFSAISEVTGFSADIPFVLQSDFNMEPEPLEELGWPWRSGDTSWGPRRRRAMPRAVTTSTASSWLQRRWQPARPPAPPRSRASGCTLIALSCFASRMVARFLGPSVEEIPIDCASTVSCLTLGMRYATAAYKPNAHLWEGIYASLDVDTLKAAKVAAHCTARDVLDGKVTEAYLHGNGHADRWAKAGAELHRACAVARRGFFGMMEVVRELSCWVAQASLIWQGMAFARCGDGAAEQELMACTHCPGSDADRDGMCMASTRGGRGPASADRVCGPALSAGSVAVARPEPAQPRRSVAPRLELQVAGWARYWTQAPEVGETMECYSEWLDHCVGYVTQILSQPRFATRLRARGRTAEEMAEEICERAWGTGMPARRAYYRWRHTLTRSQRIVSDCMRRYDDVCLRTWLAELGRE
ncbi:unnamed protein product, partial [Prorocentrum cordatum]